MTFKDLAPGDKFIPKEDADKNVLFMKTDTGGTVAIKNGKTTGAIDPALEVILIVY